MRSRIHVLRSATDRARSLRNWLLLDVDRTALTVGLLAVAFVVFLTFDMQAVLDPGDGATPLLWLFSALAGGNFTVVSIVITINQLVLTRELRSPRELFSEFDAVEDYRTAVREETKSDVVPEQPHDFLQVLTDTTRTHARELDELAESAPSPVADEASDLRTDVLDDLAPVADELEQTDESMLPALLAILNADFSSSLVHSRWIRETYPEDVSDELDAKLQELETDLEYLDVARQYLKTIWIQEDLAALSRRIAYLGFVAVVVSLAFIAYAAFLQGDPPVVGTAVVLPAAIAIGLAPFALLVAHVLRVATVAEHTVAITPFHSP